MTSGPSRVVVNHRLVVFHCPHCAYVANARGMETADVELLDHVTRVHPEALRRPA